MSISYKNERKNKKTLAKTQSAKGEKYSGFANLVLRFVTILDKASEVLYLFFRREINDFFAVIAFRH